MKVKYLTLLLIVAGALTVSSCDRDELFEREQYKKVFALLSDDQGYNIFAEEHDLALTESQGYVSAICGGALSTEKDINLAIQEDEELLADYNLRNFDASLEKYAKRLPASNYNIASYNINIPAGERKGLMPISVNANGLSPDSVYLLPLSVDRFSSYEMNPDKRTLLYRIYMKNYYATNKSEVYYNFRGKLDGLNRVGNKRVFPVRGNSVRVMAGILPFASSVNVLDAGAIVLSVDENNKVKITPWKDLKVTQVDGDPNYPNTFSIYDDGYSTYKTFLLSYNYVHDGTTYKMQEELRLEFKEEIEY
jgi:hypothetical protein